MRSAFTLIEVVVAMMLSAVLMVSLTVVMGQAMMLRNSVFMAAATLPGDELLRDQMRRDWTLAEGVLESDDGYWLLGLLLRDSSTGRMLHRNALIHYEVVSDGVSGNGWLLRTQWPTGVTDAGGMQVGPASVDAIFHGVDSIRLGTDRLDELPHVPLGMQDPMKVVQIQFSEVPSQVIIALTGAAPLGTWTHTVRRVDD